MTHEEKEYYSLVSQAFNVLAPYYDLVAAPLAGVREKVVHMTQARRDSHVLDVATGTGTQALAFARKGCQVVGVDLSEAMLAVARRKNVNGSVTFEYADATRLRFQDNSFDIACISFALHDMPRAVQVRVLREMARVTRPRGVIVIVDYALPKNRLGAWLVYQLVGLYEADYYRAFIHSELNTLLAEAGIKVAADVPVLLGAGRILKGMKAKSSA